VQDARRQRVQAEGAYAKALDPNDPIGNAQIDRQTALRELAMAKGYDQRLAALADLANANAALANAAVTVDQEMGALAASTTPDPVKQLDFQIQAAAKAMRDAVGPSAQRTARTNYNNLLLQRASTASTQREDEINFQFQMMQISAGTAASMLTTLAQASGIDKARKNALLEEARRYQLGLESPLLAGGFNLAPGNIRLPTFYDVAHAVMGGRTTTQGTHRVDARQNNTINIYVGKAADAGAVYDAMDRTTGSNLRQRLRAAGVR